MKTVSQNDPNFLDGIPPLLYKYRNWDINYHRDLVLKGQIYFSSLDQLNDPFEGCIPFSYKKEDLTLENLYAKYRRFCMDIQPLATSSEIEKGWQEQLKYQWWNNEEHKKKQKQKLKEQLREVYGIYSLCKIRDNCLLWSYYGNAHKGICIGLNSKKLAIQLQCTIGEVTYENNLPEFGLFENPMLQSQKLLGTKAIFWQHEEEFRLRKFRHARKSLTIAFDTIEEIIFGINTAQNTREEIMYAVLQLNKGVRFYEAKLHDSQFKLDIIELPPISPT